MKKIFVMLALTMGVVSANAQSVDSTAVTNTVAGDVTLTTDIYPQQEDGDIYHGLTKKLTFDRIIPPFLIFYGYIYPFLNFEFTLCFCQFASIFPPAIHLLLCHNLLFTLFAPA